MTDKIKKDIIDNTGEITMQKILNSWIPTTNKINISTGYFDVAGYGMLRKELERRIDNKPFELKLLLGKEAILPTKNSFEKYARQYDKDTQDIKSIKTSLDDAVLCPESRDDTSSLVRMLKHENVQIKQGASRFNHSKCYIMGNDVSIIGSSNFTGAGLVRNHELNAAIYQGLPIEATQQWFDRMWDMGKDTKQELIDTLLQSKFGMPPMPFEVYMKMLFERLRPLLQDVDPHTKYGETLPKFQQDAVRTGLFIISDFGGTMIADATGLGKTNMGIEIVRQKVLKEGKKVLLIAPSQVLHSMWEEKLKDVDINVRETLTMESLGRDEILENLDIYRRIDFVLIDESQNFRSKTAKRRENLMKLMSVGKRKQAVLLSATPVNNSLMDLYYQLSIITGGNDYYFYKTIGIPNLYKHMRDAANKEGLQQGLEKIQQLLDSVMVRRTRSYIKDVYRDDKINGEEIRFPAHEYSPIRYNLSELFGNVFAKILDGINSLSMAPYGIELYDNTLSEDDKRKHRVLAHLQIILLLKRFESSVKAGQASLKNKITLYQHVQRILRKGKILRVKDFNRILIKWNAVEMGENVDDADEHDDRTEFFLKEIENIETEDIGKKYDMQRLEDDLESDLAILKNLKESADSMTMDTKIDEVIKTILRDHALEKEGRKVLIFTEYTTTARYITKILQEKFPNNQVQCITGNTKQDKRKQYLRQFAPKANLPEDRQLDPQTIDILVSTEVLSEGQNLQDCNYVINYDLPWNPMRIVQRTGRIDRLTSIHDTIHSRACYPDAELDEILKLLGKLIDKINVANKTVGMDVELLGVPANTKQFNGTTTERIKVLAGNNNDGVARTIEEMERESDIMPITSPINELSKYVKEKGIDTMQSMPMGRRSGKKGEDQKAVLAYLQEKPERRVYFVNYNFKRDEASVPDDDFDAIRDVSCMPYTERHLPMDGDDNHESFEMLLHIDMLARDAIKRKNDEVVQYVRKMQGDRRTKYDENIKKIKGIVTKAEDIDEDDGERVFDILKSEYLRPWADTIDGYLAEYERSRDVSGLIRGIKQTGKWIGAEETKKDVQDTEEKEERSDLKLVGAMFITGEKFNVDGKLLNLG